MKGLSILIVNYNGAAFLRDAIFSYKEQLEKDGIDFEVLVYDNASTDNSRLIIASLEKEHKSIKAFYSGINHGFAKANNIIGNLAQFDTLAFLNNDTLTLDNKEICNYLRGTGIQEHAVYSCNIFNADKSLQKNLFAYPKVYRMIIEVFLLKPIIFKILKNKSEQQVDIDKGYFSGCYFIIKKSLFDKVGGFDESFFFYHEECDLFIRLKALHVKNILLKDKIIHYGSGGGMISEFSFKNYYTNLARLFIKHRYARAWIIKNIFATGFYLRILLLSFKIKIPYSPFSRQYKNNAGTSFDFRRIVMLHKQTLSEIKKV